MPIRRPFYVYILCNRSGTLYAGMTNNLARRVEQHRQHQVPGFTSRYGITKLVYCETVDTALAAIEREKEIKGWRRSKKVALVESANPEWKDIADTIFGA